MKITFLSEEYIKSHWIYLFLLIFLNSPLSSVFYHLSLNVKSLIVIYILSERAMNVRLMVKAFYIYFCRPILKNLTANCI